MFKTLQQLVKNNRNFLAFLVLMIIFRSAIADWNDVPTGSMQPTIQIGDRILVDKLAYDIRLPFTHISLYRIDNPERGDVIIFDSAVSEKRLVKRVIGVPGDTVAMYDNKLIINGDKLDYQLATSNVYHNDKLEQLDGQQHTIRTERRATNPIANFNPVEVPAEHYLVLGDNRDASADSRYIGFVPRHEIVGKSQRVVFSLDHDNYYLPRSERFWASFQ